MTGGNTAGFLNAMEAWRPQGTSHPLDRFRSAAWERLLDTPEPRARAASYRALRLTRLAQIAAEISPPPHRPVDRETSETTNEADLYLIDGQWIPELSNVQDTHPDLEVLAISEAHAAFGAHLRNRAVEEEGEYFALMNAALATAGVVVYVPPGVEVRAPLRIQHLGRGTPAHFSRIHFILGANSSLHLSLCGSRDAHWQSEFLEITLEEGARAWIDEHLAPAPTTICLRSTRALLKRNSELRLASCARGSASAWQDIDVRLAGEGARAEVSATHFLRGEEWAGTSVRAAHLAPGATSLQSVRSILDGRARAAFRGRIFVGKGACQTKSYQLSKYLLLKEGAIGESRPELEILNDDVKASHGATSGALDEEQILYLQSRGLSRRAARALLIRGFAESGICHTQLDALRVSGRAALEEVVGALSDE